jgi:alkylation response protein AidB-like acyl-CoA dehydrogenase
MEYGMSPELTEFRAEVRAFIAEHAPAIPPRAGVRSAENDAELKTLQEWTGRLYEAGYVGSDWPVEYGGRDDRSPEHSIIVGEELARAQAPGAQSGSVLASHALIHYGTDDQRRRHLPEIRAGRELWCQLFSEPGAGSDLASLRTRAVRNGDTYTVDGQKVWTTDGHWARYGYLLARTDADAPKHKGISYLVVDMRASGVEVRPLVQLTGEAEFNEVFLTDVFVPSDQLVGGLNEGWRVANATLSHERGINPRQLVIHLQLLDELLALATTTGAWDDWRLRQRLAEAFVEVKLFQLHNWRTLSRVQKGLEPGPEGSALKLYWSEMSKRLHDTAMAVLGPAAPLWRGASEKPGDGAGQRSWLYYQASSIFAGTNEIQRNIVGERVLGLPRG